MQTHLELIPHVVEREIIQQRVKDGYINATAMCKAAAKNWFDYRRQKTTDPYVTVLSAETGIPASELIQSLKGGDVSRQGTWVHPQIAIHLAQWLSPDFAVQVSKWVFDWMAGRRRPGPANLPYHLQRYMINNAQVPAGYFSILSELSIQLTRIMQRVDFSASVGGALR
jgi:hypothetical protein